MNAAGQELISSLDSHFVGIIWIAERDIQQDDKYFSAIDYLFDGLLSENFKEHDSSKRLNFFSTRNYGHPFFLGHIRYEDKSLSKDLEHLLSLANHVPNHQNQVFLLSEDSAICGKALQLARKNFKQFSFR